MASSPSYDSEPGFFENIKISLVRNSPLWIGKTIQLMMRFIVSTIRFIGQMFRDALGK